MSSIRTGHALSPVRRRQVHEFVEGLKDLQIRAMYSRIKVLEERVVELQDAKCAFCGARNFRRSISDSLRPR